ncbi:MAG: haloacid dehalogenase-like hydrolase, partial [Acidimicrobiales bacterium]
MPTPTFIASGPNPPEGIPEERRSAIFDLDRTLLPGSSLVHLGRALARDGVLRPADLLGFLAREVVFRRKGLSEPGAERLRERLLAMAAGFEQAPL